MLSRFCIAMGGYERAKPQRGGAEERHFCARFASTLALHARFAYSQSKIACIDRKGSEQKKRVSGSLLFEAHFNHQL